MSLILDPGAIFKVFSNLNTQVSHLAMRPIASLTFYRRYQVRTIELMVIHYLHSKLLIWAHLTGQPRQQILKRRHLVTRRNMECFQGLAILIVVCTVIICALLTRYFFLLKRTKNVPSSTTNCEDLNGHNREPGNPVKINIEWPHLNGRKQPIEHSEQPFNQVGFMIIVWTIVWS